MFKTALLFLGSWGVPLFSSCVLTALTAGLTSRWSASAVGPVMLGLLAVELLLFMAGSVFLWRGLAGVLESLPRAVTVAVHAIFQLLTYGILLVMTFVAFNR